MKKILVIGSPGSGKTTLSKKLSRQLSLPLIHLDKYCFKGSWVKHDPKDWDKKIAELISNDAWIIDGNYARTLETRINACDTIIFLDISKWICLWRIIWRVVRSHGKIRSDMGAGCKDYFDLTFIKYVFYFPKNKKVGKPYNLALLKQYTRKNIFILKNKKQIKKMFINLNPTPDFLRH